MAAMLAIGVDACGACSGAWSDACDSVSHAPRLGGRKGKPNARGPGYCFLAKAAPTHQAVDYRSS